MWFRRGPQFVLAFHCAQPIASAHMAEHSHRSAFKAPNRAFKGHSKRAEKRENKGKSEEKLRPIPKRIIHVRMLHPDVAATLSF